MTTDQQPTSLATNVGASKEIERSLLRLHRIAQLMDDQFELPIIKYRVGLDPIIGLIPGGGDWVTWAVSVYILWECIKMGIPVRILLKMGLNTTADLITGYVPGVGDLVDAVLKANKRNVKLVFQYFEAQYPEQEQPQHINIPKRALEKPRSSLFMRAIVGFFLFLFLFILAMIPIVVIWWWFQSGT